MDPSNSGDIRTSNLGGGTTNLQTTDQCTIRQPTNKKERRNSSLPGFCQVGINFANWFKQWECHLLATHLHGEQKCGHHLLPDRSVGQYLTRRNHKRNYLLQRIIQLSSGRESQNQNDDSVSFLFACRIIDLSFIGKFDLVAYQSEGLSLCLKIQGKRGKPSLWLCGFLKSQYNFLQVVFSMYGLAYMQVYRVMSTKLIFNKYMVVVR